MGSPFLKLFGKSPFRTLHEHMHAVLKGTRELEPFFQAILNNDWETAQKHQATLNTFEHQADACKRDLRLHLPKDLFMPIARSDILELVAYQDYLINRAKDIAGIVLGRRMELPDCIKNEYLTYCQLSIQASEQAYKAIRELNDLYDSGFSGKEIDIIEDMIHHLHSIENQSDEMQIKLRRCLFEYEQELPPVHVIFLYKVIEWTGQLTDHAQKIGDRLQICIAR